MSESVAFAFGTVAAVTLAAFTFEPILGLVPRTRRQSIQLIDLFALCILLVYPIGLLTWLDRTAIRQTASLPAVKLLVLGFPLLAVAVAVWHLALSVLNHREITSALRRVVMCAFAMPVAFIAILIFAFSSAWGFWLALSGEWKWIALIMLIGAAAVASLCRAAFVWSTQPKSSNKDVTAVRSPFDGGPPSLNTAARSD